jgi:hypothetical protein
MYPPINNLEPKIASLMEGWMVYGVPHQITSLLRSQLLPLVQQEFKRLIPGLDCVSTIVR